MTAIEATCELWIDGTRYPDGQLAYITNLISNPAPRSLTGWTSVDDAAYTLAYGDAEISVTRTAAATGDTIAALSALGNTPPDPAVPAGANYQRAVEVWVDADSTVGASAGFVGGQALPANVWTRVVEQFVGTGTAAEVMGLTVTRAGTLGTGVMVKLCRVQLIANPGGAELPYFDGSTPSTSEVTYRWTGAAHNSPSTATERSDLEPVAMTGLSIKWGRDNTLDQPETSTCSFHLTDPEGGTTRLDETISLGSLVLVQSELAGVRFNVFGGRVTDLNTSFDAGTNAGVCDVIAADTMGDLSNRYVGSEPWPAETLATRALRVLTAIGQGSAALYVDERPAAYIVSRMDVDRQPASALLFELASSAGAVLWTAVTDLAGSNRFKIEDPWVRESLVRFLPDPDSGLWAPTFGEGGSGYPLSGCQVIRDPVDWKRAVTDLITRATVRYRDQTTSPDPTERSVMIVDTDAEITYGARGVSVGTLLTTSADATTVASGIMAAHPTSPQWRTTGLTWDLADTPTLDPTTIELAGKLLSNVERPGLALSLRDLPYWTPTEASVALYVEGGTYSFDAGRWLLALDCSPSTGLGTSITFDEVDEAVTYQLVDRSVRYLDMVGVGP